MDNNLFAKNFVCNLSLKFGLIGVWFLFYVLCFIIIDRYGLVITGGHHSQGSGVWLGANDVATEGSFLWLPAGNPVVFQDWDSGQPNNLGGQDCAAYYHRPKQWHDVKCSLPHEMFVCEGWRYAMCSSMAWLGVKYSAERNRFNLISAGTELTRLNIVNIMVADALVLCAPRHQHPWYWPCRIRRLQFTCGRISTTCVMSLWTNEIKCKYMFMLLLNILAHKGLRITTITWLYVYYTEHVLLYETWIIIPMF